MKNLINKTFIVALCSSAVIGCKPQIDEFPEPSANGLDFSKYISIGDGTPCGYANGALNRESQLAAFPGLLAKQFELVGGPSTFHQPLLEEGKSYGFENNVATTALELKYTGFCDGDTILYPVESGSIDLIDILFFSIPEPGPYNNLAAQGTKMIYANKNGAWNGTSDTYWSKISSSKNANTSMIDDAIAQNPTFITINLGIVDVMRYAKSGGDQDNGSDDFITPFPEFHDSLYSIMNRLTENNTNGLKGAINNIIDLDAFPYITHTKYDGLILSQAEADELNSMYAADGFTFQEGRNAYVIMDSDSPNGRRRIKEGEYIIVEIPQDSLRCYGLGGKLPIRERWTLDAEEVETIQTFIEGYNSILKSAARAYNFAYVDGNSAVDLVKEGTQFAGIPLTTDFVTGNQFSLDGLNISPLGQVALANNIIASVNLLYGSTIPLIDATKTPAVIFK